MEVTHILVALYSLPVIMALYPRLIPSSTEDHSTFTHLQSCHPPISTWTLFWKSQPYQEMYGYCVIYESDWVLVGKILGRWKPVSTAKKKRKVNNAYREIPTSTHLLRLNQQKPLLASKLRQDFLTLNPVRKAWEIYDTGWKGNRILMDSFSLKRNEFIKLPLLNRAGIMKKVTFFTYYSICIPVSDSSNRHRCRNQQAVVLYIHRHFCTWAENRVDLFLGEIPDPLWRRKSKWNGMLSPTFNSLPCIVGLVNRLYKIFLGYRPSSWEVKNGKIYSWKKRKRIFSTKEWAMVWAEVFLTDWWLHCQLNFSPFLSRLSNCWAK